MRTADRPARFDAVIYPNQSLGPHAFVLLMSVFGIVTLGLSLVFVHAGAWPVSGFLGLDLLLLFLAFRWARRESRRWQRIVLDEDGLHVEVGDGRGARRYWRFEPYWVRVQIDEPPTRHSLVRLSSHGRTLRIGHDLTPAERVDLARALRAAIAHDT
ncbi:MAG: DUF2244 domain-containing protein [Geminicoccaceae bacterium]|nr:DUF2244 domain-containing protein [Geminicoccaceae bacterium]